LKKRAILVCLDGCGPDYIEKSDVPNIRKLCRNGYYVKGKSVIPTVTNVNNVSIITGVYPEKHGITSNFYYNELGQEVYIESPEFIMTKTIFQMAAQNNLTSALLTSKDKLCTLLRRGAHIAFSAEAPPKWVVDSIGPPPNIYSIEVNSWLFKACRLVIEKYDPNFIYVATTDYAMHKYPPEAPESKWNMQIIDDAIGNLIELVDKKQTVLCITADHGMSDKRRAIDLKVLLDEYKIKAKVASTIKDRYTVHHAGLSGSAYIYLENKGDLQKAFHLLANAEGVDRILTRDEAVKLYHLHPDRIGDLVVFGEKEYVFGEIGAPDERICCLDVQIRSHGSLYEQEIPIIIYNLAEKVKVVENKDLGNLIAHYLK